METKKISFLTKIYCYACRLAIVVGMKVMFRPKIRYENKKIDKEARKKPSIIIANHTSLYDALFIYSIMQNHHGYILTAKDWYDKPFFGTIIAGNRTIPIDRNGLDTGWIRDCKKVIDEGNSVFIFPEGHRSKTGEFEEFKSGFALLSKMTGAPIIPVYLSGNYDKFLGERKKAYIGVPMELGKPQAGMSADYLTEEGVRFRNHMMAMRIRSNQIFATRKSRKETSNFEAREYAGNRADK